MRIIAGEYRSRKLNAPKGDNTRPTLDQVKEAVFSSLGGFFEGGKVLDLFSGSGSIGLEAISRGMELGIFNDSNREAFNIIKENINTLKLQERCKVYSLDYHKLLSLMEKENYSFDLIYLDPPYNLGKYAEILELIYQYNLLAKDGRIVVESLKGEQYDSPENFECYKTNNYGISKIAYYRRKI